MSLCVFQPNDVSTIGVIYLFFLQMSSGKKHGEKRQHVVVSESEEEDVLSDPVNVSDI